VKPEFFCLLPAQMLHSSLSVADYGLHNNWRKEIAGGKPLHPCFIEFDKGKYI
jgi:hypothetical protein